MEVTTMTTEKTVQSLAKELSVAFVWDTRNDGEKFCKLKDGSPQWMTDAIHEAHGSTLPDDTLYEFCERTADAIADSEDAEEAIAEMEPDTYTHDLTAWLHARIDHVDYLTQALDEYAGCGEVDGFRLLALAQSIQLREVAEALLKALQNLADTDEVEAR